MCRTFWISLSLIGACVLTAGRLEAQRSTPSARSNPVLETARYLVKAHDSIALTRGRMELMQAQMASVRAKLKTAKISPEAKAKILGHLDKSDPLVRVGIDHLRSWEEATGKVKDGMDLYGEMTNIVTIAKGLDPKSGDLGANLRALSQALDSYGGEVPLLGDILQAYGQVTLALLDALDRLAENFQERVRQGHVGGETSHLYPHRNKALFYQKPDGERVFKEYLYAPSGPSYAYRPVDDEWKRVLLWDEGADYWYIINHRVDVQQVYSDHMLIGIDLGPASMWRKLRQDIYEKHQKVREKAQPLFEFLNKNMATIAQCASVNTTDLAIHKLDLFRARFTYVEDFQPRVQTMMKQLFDCMCQKGHPEAAEKVRSHALAVGFEEAKQWKCDQGPWTLKLARTFSGMNPRVDFGGKAVVHFDGRIDFSSTIDKVDKFYPDFGIRTKSIDVAYRFTEVKKTPTGCFTLYYTTTRVEVYDEYISYQKIWVTKPPSVSGPTPEAVTIECSGVLSNTKFFEGSQGKVTWASSRPDEPAAATRGFAGNWDVYMYPTATSPPPQPSRVRIAIEGNDAVAYEETGAMLYRGPLSSGGQVWNASKMVGNVLVMKVENARLSADSNRFEGTWSGAAPHGYPIKGVRVGTGGLVPLPPTIPTPVQPTPPVIPPPPVLIPPTPQAAEVQLSYASPHAQVSLAPGATLKVHISLSAGTGYTLQPVSPPAGAATLMRGPVVEPPKTKLIGAPSTYHYDYRIGASPPRSFTIVYRLVRFGSTSGQYDVTVTTLSPATPSIPKTGANEVVVPNVVGMDANAARSALQAKGLILKTPAGVRSDKIVEQHPSAGTRVNEGSSVTVSFPLTQFTTVPSLVGLKYAQCITKLQEANLRMQMEGSPQQGGAIRQNPTAGTKVKVDTSVVVVFPSVAPPVAVPNVVGMNGSAARAEIERRGLVFRAMRGDPTGTASSQVPPAGSMVPKGSPVMVAFAAAPTPPQAMVAVPNVMGADYGNATRQLQAAGLVPRPTGDTQNGRVRNQTPSAGSMVPRGSSVNLQFVRSRS